MARRTVPIEEAIARLGDAPDIHTFANPGGMLLGCDHAREGLIEAMRAKGVEEAGGMAAGMGHTLAIVNYFPDGGPLFIEAAPSPQAPAPQSTRRDVAPAPPPVEETVDTSTGEVTPAPAPDDNPLFGDGRR